MSKSIEEKIEKGKMGKWAKGKGKWQQENGKGGKGQKGEGGSRC
jgi:hypothetical protein